jgi:hypothetical protein
MSAGVIGLIIGLILAIITVILILWGGSKKEGGGEKVAQVQAPVARGKKDDLAIIEGIGPKIADVLKKNGIATFEQLAEAKVSTLDKILKDNGLNLAQPDTWPQQARLAAAGKMDELKALQEKLNAGKKE